MAWRRAGLALALLGCAGCTLAVRASGGVLGGRWGLYALLVLWLALAAAAALLTDVALPSRAAVRRRGRQPPSPCTRWR